METKKLVLIIILSTSLLFLWDAWEKEIRTTAPQTTSDTLTASVAGSTDQRHDALPVPGDELVTASGNTTASDIEGVTPSITPRLLEEGEKIRVTTDLVIAEIDTAGGDIRRLGLLKHPSREDETKPYDLLQNSTAHISVAQSGLIGDELPSHKTKYTVESEVHNYELRPGDDTVVVRLLAPEVNGIQVAKTYTFHRGTYVIDVAFEIANHSDSSIQPFSYFQILRDGNQPEASSALMMPSYLGAAIYTDEGKFQKIKFSDLDKNKADYPANDDNGWIAMLEHYFVTAWIPEQQTPREYYAKRLTANHYTAGIIAPVGSVSPGQTKTVSEQLYAGPQEQKKLAELAPGLDLTVDYGWLTIIAKPLFWLLSFYHSYVGNWGIAIILLTLTVKLIFFPLSAAGYRSMAKLRVVTPKLQRIREQYSGDRQRMHQAMMEFYKEEKINPMGGCLPILVQIPVFIALFWTLLAAVELRYAPLTLWITDMSVPDPYYVLPLLMGVSMWLQSKLSPVPADPIQAKIMKIMPVAFSIFFFFFPSGLVLYSLCNNILSIAQQWQITRMFERKAEEDAQKDKTRIKGKVKNKPDNGELLLAAPASSADDKDGGKSEIGNDEQSVLSTEDAEKEKSKPGAKPKGKTVVKRARKK
ncbi:MAG: membrane protein insertase YidC [Nitrosomonas sp.]|nr:membrane protein insertase YidC [Nitrosomonas sp.]